LFLANGPAWAGDEERALAAIAQEQGKIDAAAKLKAGDFNPAVLAKVQGALRLAQEQLKSGKEQAVIRSAVDAQQFADTAIGQSQVRAGTDAQMQASAAVSAQQDVAAATTTVTTETVKTAPAPVARKAIPVKRKGVRRTTSPARASVVEKTITTVTNR
jgi:protein phosphatase 1 regulatory subunit 37